MRTKQRNNLAETACHERVAQNTDVYAVKARNYKGLRRGIAGITGTSTITAVRSFFVRRVGVIIRSGANPLRN